MPVYDGTPAHGFLKMLEPTSPPAPGDPARMAARITESVDVEPAPLRLVLGSQALQSTVATLRKRIEAFEAQSELAASTDFPSVRRESPARVAAIAKLKNGRRT